MSVKPSIESIFCSAIEIESPDGRRALVEQACGEDMDLRHQVERLLHAHFEGRSILDALVRPVATIDEPLRETAGTVIGPYKLIEPIGEGGMGTVWMAQQTEPVKRVVALKLIKAGMDSKQVIARFEAERQALALMDHPNIARVLDGGTTGAGRPYFVMDLVKGVPITRYCDQHHLTPRQRLELFIPVCQAVQHAHQKGIIHRDLKPSNVLVALYDGKPVPKVIDFGVAKAAGQSLTDKTLVTGFGNIVGTLEYMSPEQAEVNQLDIDTRSDIYSLGVLLYELLAGSTPFSRKDLEKAGMLEMLRVIREEEPSKPSTKLSTADGLPTLAANRGTEPAKLTKLVRGELDWIVMKALEKDRSRRYETANGFAADVQRYLADEAVQACPPSAGYRLRKFARRNKGGLAVTALVLFFLVLLGSGGGWAVRDRSAREAEAAQQQAARQGKAAGQVESVFAEVDRLEKEQRWPEALAAARRAEAAVAGGEADPETAKRVRDRLKDLEFLDRLAQIRMQQPTSFKGLTGSRAGTDPEYAQAFRDYGVDIDELTVETSINRLKTRPALAIPLAASLDAWVSIRRIVPGAAESSWRRLVAVARGIDPDPVRDRIRATRLRPVAEVQDELRRLVDSIDVRAQRPATLHPLAIVDGVRYSDASLRLLRDAQAAHPGDFWLNFELGHALEKRRDHEGAIRFYTAAVSIRPNSASAHNNLGNALRDQKKLDEAIRHLRESIDLAPTSPAYSNLGLALRDQKKLEEAIDCFKKAIDTDPTWAGSHNNLGLSYCDLKEYGKAIACFRKAMDLDPNEPKYASNCELTYNDLGRLLREQRKLDEAIDAFRKAIEINPKSDVAYANLGVALRDQKKLDEAIDAFRKAIEIDPSYAWAHNNLGISYIGLKDYGKAIACFRKAIDLDAKNSTYTRNCATAYDALGRVLREQNKLDEAIDAFRKAIELDPKASGAYFKLGVALANQKKLEEAIDAFRKCIELNPKYALAHYNLGVVLRDQNQLDEAIAAFRKAIEFDPKYGNAHHNLGNALRQQGKLVEAIAAYREAIEFFPTNAEFHNGLAWLLATCSDARLRDPRQAVALAKKATELKPEDGIYRNTLGAAYYRAGNWKEATAALEKSVELRKGGNSSDWFFLAMTYWRLGEKDKAREWHDKAVQWMDKNQPKNEELRRFHAEAAELLGVKEAKM